jgi:hypothetical protein
MYSSGTEKRMRERWGSVVPSGLTGLIVRTDDIAGLELVAELAGTRDTAEAAS